MLLPMVVLMVIQMMLMDIHIILLSCPLPLMRLLFVSRLRQEALMGWQVKVVFLMSCL